MFSCLYIQICIVNYPLGALHKQTADEKYLLKSSRKFQKAKLELSVLWQLFAYYLHCISCYK